LDICFKEESFSVVKIDGISSKDIIKKIKENDAKNPGMIEMKFINDYKFSMANFRMKLFDKNEKFSNAFSSFRMNFSNLLYFSYNL